MQLNKVHHVITIARVAAELGEDEDWLWEVAGEMEPEDGLIWVNGPGDDGLMDFSALDLSGAVIKAAFSVFRYPSAGRRRGCSSLWSLLRRSGLALWSAMRS